MYKLLGKSNTVIVSLQTQIALAGLICIQMEQRSEGSLINAIEGGTSSSVIVYNSWPVHIPLSITQCGVMPSVSKYCDVYCLPGFIWPCAMRFCNAHYGQYLEFCGAVC